MKKYYINYQHSTGTGHVYWSVASKLTEEEKQKAISFVEKEAGLKEVRILDYVAHDH